VNTIVLRDTLLALLFLYVVLGIALTKKEKKVKIMNFALTNFSAALIGSTVGRKSKNAVICLCQCQRLLYLRWAAAIYAF
jgi:hypothetical protein